MLKSGGQHAGWDDGQNHAHRVSVYAETGIAHTGNMLLTGCPVLFISLLILISVKSHRSIQCLTFLSSVSICICDILDTAVSLDIEHLAITTALFIFFL